MGNKRHLVLYAIGAILLLAAAGVFLILREHTLSDSAYLEVQQQSLSTSTPFIATSTQSQSTQTAQAKTAPAQHPFRFEIVTSQAAQEKGLGGRADVPEDYGMLFAFPNDQKIGFWMKDMLVPIDIVWLSDTGVVLGIEDSLSPETYPSVFYAPQPVRYVLETRAGEMRRQGIAVGTRIMLPLPYGQGVSQ